jgi:hypothetical protein
MTMCIGLSLFFVRAGSLVKDPSLLCYLPTCSGPLRETLRRQEIFARALYEPVASIGLCLFFTKIQHSLSHASYTTIVLFMKIAMSFIQVIKVSVNIKRIL